MNWLTRSPFYVFGSRICSILRIMLKVQISMLAGVVMSTSLVVGVPAHADSASDFLAMVSAKGFNVGDKPDDVQLTLSNAMAICHMMQYGYTPEVASRQVKYQFPNASPEQATEFVDAARATLCAHLFAPLKPGGY